MKKYLLIIPFFLFPFFNIASANTCYEYYKDSAPSVYYCLFQGNYYLKPENGYCVCNDRNNAWKCNIGYRDTGYSCIKNTYSTSHQNTTYYNTYSCYFNGRYVLKPINGYCVSGDPYNAWKCDSGYRDTGYSCVKNTYKSCTCVDVTSWDYNWNNDMRCTRSNGSTFYTSYSGARTCTDY